MPATWPRICIPARRATIVGERKIAAGTPSLRAAGRPADARTAGWRADLAGAAGLALPLLAGCESAPSALDPRGPRAADIAGLWWYMLIAGTAVFVIVMALLLIGLFRRRRATVTERVGPLSSLSFVVWGGAIIPAIILITVVLSTLRTLASVATPGTGPDLVVEVVGYQFWWEVRYPQYGFVTANEIHIPAGRPVEMRFVGADVIHSFWVPQLAGKIDLIPGAPADIWLQADEPGVYRGQCAEYCGAQHAKMALLVIAETPDDFDRWAADQARAARVPDDPVAWQGQQVFLNSTCPACHRIRGTSATGPVGPDLTHLASRRTIAAAILPNNPGTLGGWILDPQSIKPGSLMPPTQLSSDELIALLAYLDTLE